MSSTAPKIVKAAPAKRPKETPPPQGVKLPVKGPERAYLMSLVGRQVRVFLREPIATTRTVIAWLRYVDIYTVGLSEQKEGELLVVWKSALVGLEPAPA